MGFILFFLFLIFGTYYFILKDYSVADFKESLRNCNKIYIFISFLFLFFYAFWASLFLKRTLYHFHKKINWYQAFGYLFTEVYFSAITPSSIGGQPVQMVEMNKDEIPYRVNSVVVLLNTLLYKIALIVLATILILIYQKDIFHQNILFSWLVALGFITTIFVIILFILLIYSKKFISNIILKFINIGYKLHILKEKQKYIDKLEEAIINYQECAEFTKQNPKILIELFFYMLMQRLSLLSISYMIYLAFGLSQYNYFEVLAFQVCITLASDFLPFPGGVVVSEGLLLEINQFLYGALLATSGMILLRGISFYIFVIFSGLFYVLFHFKKRQKAVEV